MEEESWNAPLPAAAAKLRVLLREVDSCCEPLWSGSALRFAIFRYTEIFLPMLAAHLHYRNAIALRGPSLDRMKVLLKMTMRKLKKAYYETTSDPVYMTVMDDSAEKANLLSPFHPLDKYRVPQAASPVPPLDVAFVWALHRLSPLDYERDCRALFGVVLPAGREGGVTGLDYVSAANSNEARSATARLQWSVFAKAARELEMRGFFRRRRTRKIMRDFLPRHTWPRFNSGKKLESFSLADKASRRWTPPIEYDLEAAAGRQKQFLYNIAAPYFETEAAMARGADRYAKFLALMKANKGVFLVPMYDIDLVWHAHILLSTTKYRADCETVVGRFINHKEDDDREEGGELQNGFRRTVKLWEAAYGEKYEDKDTNYKGKLPDEHRRVFDEEDSVIVKADDEFRKQFVKEAVCAECTEKKALDMHKECREEFLLAVRTGRVGQAQGGACAGLYSKGYRGSATLFAAAGGACGAFAGDAGGGCGCGGGGGNCGAGACGMGAGGCGGAGCAGGGCGGGGCGGGGCGGGC